MANTSSYLDLLTQVDEVTRRIGVLVNEIRPLSQHIMAGTADANIIEKNNRLQDEIGSLDKLREQLGKAAQLARHRSF